MHLDQADAGALGSDREGLGVAEELRAGAADRDHHDSARAIAGSSLRDGEGDEAFWGARVEDERLKRGNFFLKASSFLDLG